MKNFLWLIIILFVMSGCADHIPKHVVSKTFYNSDGTVDFVQETTGAPPARSDAEAKAKIECYKAIKEHQDQENHMTLGLTPELRAMVLQAQVFKALLAQVQGVSVYAACEHKDENVYSYLVKDTEAANKTRQAFSSGLWSSVPYLGMAFLGYHGIKNAGDTVNGNSYSTGAGDNNIQYSNQDITASGSNSSVNLGDVVFDDKYSYEGIDISGGEY